MNWGPNWLDRSRHDPDELARRVEHALAADRWVTDGNYRRALPLIFRRATDIVWLDYDRAVVMSRVIRRSIGRALSGGELWPGTGNREDWRRWIQKDHPIRWAWDTFDRRRVQYAELFADPRLAHARLHRLRRPREADDLVEDLGRRAAEATA